jgi:predicted site-specific integrase-resolvase
MRISKAAQECGVSADLIRRLERAGLLPPATRDLNGHRRYSADDIRRVRAIVIPERPAPRSSPPPSSGWLNKPRGSQRDSVR